MNQVFAEPDRTFLLALARDSIQEFFHSGRLPSREEASIPPVLREPAACFVTLSIRGDLRGCIGNIYPRDPLFKAVIKNACSAAFHDRRFPPLNRPELVDLGIEISVLSEPAPLPFGSTEELLQKLRPGVDGVVLKMDEKTATFLPQVWEKFPDPTHFLNALALKAGLPKSAWRDPEAAVLTYQVESFESQPN